MFNVLFVMDIKKYIMAWFNYIIRTISFGLQSFNILRINCQMANTVEFKIVIYLDLCDLHIVI